MTEGTVSALITLRVAGLGDGAAPPVERNEFVELPIAEAVALGYRPGEGGESAVARSWRIDASVTFGV